MVSLITRGAVVGVGGLSIAAYRNAKSVAKQNSPFRRYWERHLLLTLDELETRAQAGRPLPLIYVALGDSAAQGLGADCVEDGYVPRLASGIGQATGREVALLNLSLSGGTVASVLGTQLKQLAGLRIAGQPVTPDVVTLDIGGNDVGVEGLTIAEFGRRFDELAKAIPSPAFIADIPSFRPTKSAERAKKMSAEMHRAAAENGHTIIGLEALSETFSVKEYILKYHAPDLFHPNNPWYAKWSELFMPEIAAKLGVDAPNMADVPAWQGIAVD